MTFQAGEVVMLKSGGMQMTVAGVDEDGVQCLWLGEEGELFRETLPASVLELVLSASANDDDDEKEDEEEDEADDREDDEDEDEEEDEDDKEKAERKVA